MNSGFPVVGDLLVRGLASYGERVCAIEADRRLSYRALCLRAARLGNALRGLGLGPAERVGLLADNAVLCIEAYLGVPAAGLVLMPINSRLALAEIRAILEDSGCTALLVGPGYEDIAGAAVSERDTRLIFAAADRGALSVESLIQAGSEQLHLGASPEGTAYLYYTSGTTGRPKGVMLSHRNVLAGALSGVASMSFTGAHAWLHAAPMFHLADAFAIWAITWVGARHVCARFSPEEAVRLIAGEQVTHTLLVPTALDRLADAAAASGTRLASLKTLFYGGAPMPGPIFNKAQELLDARLVATYGMTETSGLLTVGDCDGQAREFSPGNVGRDVPLVAIDIVGDDGAPLAPGEEGELVVRSPVVMQGYRGLEALTAEVLENGGLHTGDIGRRESDGSLTLIDRKKDMIISGGENIYSREVEMVLEQHPAVAEVAVVGRPDPQWGEAVCAFVKFAPGTRLSLEELRQHGRASLAGYKLPRRLVVVDELPRTSSGKVSKGELRKRAAEQNS